VTIPLLAIHPQKQYSIAMAYKDSLFRSLCGNEKAVLDWKVEKTLSENEKTVILNILRSK